MVQFVALGVLAMPSGWPRSLAEFVDLDRYGVSKNSMISDVQPDLSLAGHTYMAMVDAEPATLVTILTGYPITPGYDT